MWLPLWWGNKDGVVAHFVNMASFVSMACFVTMAHFWHILSPWHVLSAWHSIKFDALPALLITCQVVTKRARRFTYSLYILSPLCQQQHKLSLPSMCVCVRVYICVCMCVFVERESVCVHVHVCVCVCVHACAWVSACVCVCVDPMSHLWQKCMHRWQKWWQNVWQQTPTHTMLIPYGMHLSEYICAYWVAPECSAKIWLQQQQITSCQAWLVLVCDSVIVKIVIIIYNDAELVTVLYLYTFYRQTHKHVCTHAHTHTCTRTHT